MYCRIPLCFSCMRVSSIAIMRRVLPTLIALCALWLCCLFPAHAEGKKWALLIGIEEYDRAEISHLDFAVKDVNAIARALQQNLGYEAANIRTMTSAIKDANDSNRPTNDNVIATLERLAKSVGPKDTFLFYFTGHGFNKEGQNFLASVNANPFSVNTLRRSAIPLADLQQVMQAFKARQVLFIIDACRNDPEKGKGEGDNKLTGDFSKSLVVASRSARAGSAGVLFACSEGERAFEDPSKGQSIFTYYLLEALAGKTGNKGALAMADVTAYVRKQVGIWAKEHGKKQTPELLPKEANQLVLADRITASSFPVEQAVIKLLDTRTALTISSNPSGAKVFLDGQDTGKTTPVTLEVDLGFKDTEEVEVGLQKPNYKTLVLTARLQRGKTLKLEQALKTAPVISGVSSGRPTEAHKLDTPPVLNFVVDDIDGKPVNLAQYTGNVILIVNVASKCGNTPQYRDLQAAYNQYREKGFTILGFPSNDFGRQEPGSEAEIKQFCQELYNVTFPMFSKIRVKGDDATPLYKFLTDPKTDPEFGKPIDWNFAKFLINRKGEIVARFPASLSPSSPIIVKAIEDALKEEK